MTDLDPLLREAMASVRKPVDARPSLTDVRRRARRRTHRRMAVTAGAVACTGVATAALIIRRDSILSPGAGTSATLPEGAPTTMVYLPAGELSTTTVYPASTMTITATVVWDALGNAQYDPSGSGRPIEPPDQAAVDVMPTAQQFGCTSGDCAAMFTYVVWHEIAKTLGFGDVVAMQAANPAIDFSKPPVEGDVLESPYIPFLTPTGGGDVTTTSLISATSSVALIDGGAPSGAMDDAHQRLAGYNPTIVAGTGKTVEQTMIMPIHDTGSIAAAVAGQLGLDGFDTWDPSFAAGPVVGVVAVIVGPDYFDRVHTPVPTAPVTTTTTIG
jgi:hypothetical protein